MSLTMRGLTSSAAGGGERQDRRPDRRAPPGLESPVVGKEAKKVTLLKIQSNVQSTVNASALFLQQNLQKALSARTQEPSTLARSLERPE